MYVSVGESTLKLIMLWLHSFVSLIGETPVVCHDEKCALRMVSDWSQFVAQKAKSWTETNLDWIERFSGPLLITMYHQLVQNTSQELNLILDFLQVTYHWRIQKLIDDVQPHTQLHCMP